MSSILTAIIIVFLLLGMKKGRTGTNRRLSSQAEEMRRRNPSTETGFSGQIAPDRAQTFSERYREDPASVAGMKGRASAVPAAGRSAILEADNELDTMLAGRKNRRVPGKDTTQGTGMFGSIFGSNGTESRSRLKDSSLFAGFEDRSNDWLAQQLREEQRTKVRIMSEMMSLKIDHEKEHRKINRVIGR